MIATAKLRKVEYAPAIVYNSTVPTTKMLVGRTTIYATDKTKQTQIYNGQSEVRLIASLLKCCFYLHG